jgi:predicted GIY-YIG superfamily endonuclease
MVKRRAWRHQRGSQNPYIEDEQTTQWCCLFVFDIRILTSPLVSSISSFDHCVVCSSSIYGFWLPLWCLQTLPLTIVLSVPLRYNDSGCPFVVFKLVLWPLCCLFVFDIKILVYRRWTDNTMVKRRVWRHQRGSQNLYIEDEQTTQWSKEEFEDTKGVVRIRISKMNRQHNGQRTSLKTPKG